MTPTEIRTTYLEELVAIAPDLDADTVGDNDHIQTDLALDSMDVLNLVTALHDRLGVNIPEGDYPQIATVALAVDYLGRMIALKSKG
ncbi:acyl carrier protein [Antarcticimicrobium luteum]|uniref:Acyl carrier protein n=1 Tax=Antarcticimicrobium luteum TaxID=2547397 RepID=A0A4R5UZY7_9RHOB|nr:phosphopantetheine-binding protein [Antarcticimicrobium luteum]TDK45038.1 acyl carrier protein [Antarcticimicrobium luteum]